MKTNKSWNEYERTIDFFERISSSDSSNFRRNVLLALSSFFNYDHATFFVTDEQRKLADPVLLNIDSGFMNDYLEYYHNTDIFYPNKLISMDYHRKKGVLTITDLMTYTEFEKTEFYYDFLKKQNLYHELAIVLFYGDKMVGGIGLFKPKGDRFTDQDVQRVKSLSKCIATTLHKNLEIKKELHHKELYEVSFSNSPVGMVIFNKDLDIIYANSLSLLLGQNIFNRKVTEQELVRLTLQHLGSSWSSGRHKTFLSPALKEYTAHIIPLTSDRQLYQQKPVFLLTITPEKIIPEEKNGVKHINDYGLTNREVEILPLVLRGMTNQEIADELYITPVTVKAHLQKIFKKMGVSNRTSLCHKLNLIKARQGWSL